MVTHSGAARAYVVETADKPRVNSGRGAISAMLLPSGRGPLEPRVLSTFTEALELYSEDGRIRPGYNEAFYQLREYFRYSDRLLVKRVHNDARNANLWVRGSEFEETGGLETSGSAFGLNALAPTTGFNFLTASGGPNLTAAKVQFIQNGIRFTDPVLKDVLNTTPITFTEPPIGVSLPGTITANTPYYADFVQEMGDDGITYYVARLATSETNRDNGTFLSFPALPDATRLYDITMTASALETVTDPKDYRMLLFYAANPGMWGNSITVKVLEDYRAVRLPNTYQITVNYRGLDQEVFIASNDREALDEMGRSLFIETVMARSRYVRAAFNPIFDGDTLPRDGSFKLRNGSNGDLVTDAEMVSALYELGDSSKYDFIFLGDSGWGTEAYHSAIISLLNKRGDAMAVLGAPYEADAAPNYPESVIDYKLNQLASVSDYAAMFTPHVSQFEPTLNREVMLSPSGIVMGRMARNFQTLDPWTPTAGNENGTLELNGVSRSISAAAADLLYEAGINPILASRERGIRIWGNKTLRMTNVDTNRINVRMTLIYLKPPLQDLGDDFLFSLNNFENEDNTRDDLKGRIDNFLDSVKRRGGIYDFLTICDATNNTPFDVENHVLNVTVKVKVVQSIEWIPIEVQVTSYGTQLRVGAVIS